MNKILKFFLYTIGGVTVVVIGIILFVFVSAWMTSRNNHQQLLASGADIVTDGMTFRDLNKNGKVDVYEDPRYTTEERVEDLLSQMNVEEKAGMMFHTMIGIHPDGKLLEAPILTNLLSYGPINSTLVVKKKMNHFNVFSIPSVESFVRWHNALQKMAEQTRLGIPITISTNPSNHVTMNPNVAMFSGMLSMWPEPLGFGAINDSLLMVQFANIARQEYLAMGIRMALHPMADLATEPRWPCINGTFGEDAETAAMLTAAYIRGFQGDSLTNKSVACMTKHFSGGGPQKEGLDPHFTFQKGQVYPGNNFQYHLIPFESAFKAKTAAIMPYYGVPMGQTSEDVGFAFNKEIITDLLRGKYQYDGVVCTDWGLITDGKILGMTFKPASAHGVEELSVEQRLYWD